jgi:hypothetical protein
MLVVISGIDSVPVQFIATQVAAKLNTIAIDGYTAEMDDDGDFLIRDPDGAVVYAPSTFDENDVPKFEESIDTLLTQEGGVELYERFDALVKDAHGTGRPTYFRNTFINLANDYGIDIPDEPDETEEERLHRYKQGIESYQALLDNYHNSKAEVEVFAGCFSKTFIESLRRDLGEDNVHVINITRNPSVIRALATIGPTILTDDDEFLRQIRTHDTMVTSCILSELDYVNTVKFEDILSAGLLTVNGVDVDLPPKLGKYNAYLTSYEKDNIYSMSEDEMTSWNTTLQAYDWVAVMSELDKLVWDGKDDLSADAQTVAVADHVPSNIFSVLDYTPVSYGEIVAEA